MQDIGINQPLFGKFYHMKIRKSAQNNWQKELFKVELMQIDSGHSLAKLAKW